MADMRETNMKRVIIFFFLIFLSVACCKESESEKITKLLIPGIDLSVIEDGKYTGRFIHHNSLYETEVMMRDHRIENIRVLQSEGDKYDQKAFAVIQSVIDQQSLQVNAVTGATKSSKLYLITIYSALTGEEIELQ
jgi:uncharacterized protein with FMN-binding domain